MTLLLPCRVWYKHRNNLFLPTYAETTSMALVRAFNTAVESILFTNIVYWMMGYTRTAGVPVQKRTAGDASTSCTPATVSFPPSAWLLICWLSGTASLGCPGVCMCCLGLRLAGLHAISHVLQGVYHAGAYFTYLLIMSLISLSMSALFRFIGSVSATPVHAQAFGSLGLLTLILTSGFAIIRRECKPACVLDCMLGMKLPLP
jgi:hypothetical protein